MKAKTQNTRHRFKIIRRNAKKNQMRQFVGTRASRSLHVIALLAIGAGFAMIPSAYAQRNPDSAPRRTQTDSQPASEPNTLIVGFRSQKSRADHARIHTERGYQSIHSFSFVNADVVQVPPSTDIQAAANSYANDPNVAYVEPNYIVYADAVPNDPNFDKLWGFHNANDTDIDAPEAWSQTTGSSQVTVAIIDTGVDYTHPDLAKNMWTNEPELNGAPGVDDDGNGIVDDVFGARWTDNNGIASSGDPMDDHSHGTHVAGTIGAAGNDAIGIPGVNWHVKIMALKFLKANGGGSIADAVAALEYAVKMGARISNNSWGGGGYSQTMDNMLEFARQNGHLFVAAAGNNGTDNDVNPHYPSSYTHDNVLSVAASDNSDSQASFSNWGATSVDLAAPGVGTYSTIPNSEYDYKSGTSMATPHVTGVAALLLSELPTATYVNLREWILGSVDVRAAWQGKTITGGRLNAFQALQFAVSNDGIVELGSEAIACFTTSLDVTIKDADLFGQGAHAVDLVAYDQNDQPTDVVQLTLAEELDSDVGLFKGIATLQSAAPVMNDDVLQIDNAVKVVASYDDAKNSNNQPVTVTDEAPFDCQTPIVTGINTELVGLGRVRVHFQISEPASGFVAFGTTCDPANQQSVAFTAAESHEVEMTGLQPETQYAFKVFVEDAAGNQTIVDNNGECFWFETPCQTTLYAVDFNGDADGYSLEALWHVAENTCKGSEPGHSAGGHLYFGQDDTCNYDVGTATGSATSPAIDLSGAVSPELRFRYCLATEVNPDFDDATVRVSTNGTDFSTVASNKPNAGETALADPTDGWIEANVDLSAYQGETIWVQFRFVTKDADYNNFDGFYVDDVAVVGICVKPKTGAISVNLNPAQAVDAGAKWRIDGGAWLDDGTIVSDLTLGEHGIEYKTISGWLNPPKKTVTVFADNVTDVQGAYQQQTVTGALKITLGPQAAVAAGAKWRLKGGVWRTTGTVMNNLSVGQYTIEFSNVGSHYTPNAKLLNVTANAMTEINVIYVEAQVIKDPPHLGCWVGSTGSGSSAPPVDFLILALTVTCIGFYRKWIPRFGTSKNFGPSLAWN